MPTYVVYTGRNATNPHRTLRAVSEDGETTHVLRFDDEAKAREMAEKYGGELFGDDRTSALLAAYGRAFPD